MADLSPSNIFLFPMSYGQSQLWYLNQIDPTSTAYNIPFAFRCSGPLNFDALRQALQTQVDRFEVLRTNFDVVDGMPKQILKPTRDVEFAIEKLPETSKSEQDGLVRKLIDQEATRPFDLQTDLMIRSKLIQVHDTDNILLLSFHHIAVDHIAILRLKEEIENAYAAILKGEKVAEGQDELQYADFTIWQQENMCGDVLEEKLAYWADEFENRASFLPLATDYPRPPVQSYNGAEIYFSFSPEVSDGIRNLCKQHKISVFVALLTTLKILFFRYTRQNDVTVGCPFANRTQDELEAVVGLFMNLLPIASTVSGEQSFLDLFQQVKSTVTRAQGFQDTPFERIIQKIRHDRNPAYNPLLQTWFTFQEPPMVLDIAGTNVESLTIHNGGAKLDLSFWLWEEDATIKGLIEFNTDLFARSSVERIAGHYEQLLKEIISDPAQAVDSLELLTKEEQTQIFSTWNDTRKTLPSDCVVDLIAEVAANNPDKIAVSSEHGSSSYSELMASANAIARSLAERKIPRGSFIAVCHDRTPALLASLIGIWRYGAAYLPLDPGYPDDRLKFMVEDSGAALILTEDSSAARFADWGIPVLQREHVAISQEAEPLIDVLVAEKSDPAYVIYTSGSTGTPKGVQISNRAVTNFLGAMKERPGFKADDILAAVTTISFDISVLEMFLPLVVGGQVHLISRERASDGNTLAEAIKNSKASVFQATPSTMKMLIDTGWNGDEKIKLLCGGESLLIDLATELVSRSGELWNMYGPTETTVWSTAMLIDNTDTEIRIGRPIANTVVRILDEYMHAVPVGIPGELYIGGLGLSDGYLNRPDLNEEQFVDDPFDNHGDKLYKTGDRVKWAQDGTLVHIGRNDRQVKLRGFRIELEEIERVVAESSDNQNVAVTTWQAGPGDVRLVAYIAGESSLSTMQLRKLLRRKLPDFMIPQHFVELQTLPLTANGKVDRKNLPSPTTVGQKIKKQKPRGESQILLASVWEEILGQPGVSPEDNFFEVGGHSLLAMRVVAEVEQRTGVRLTARMIVMQSLAELADVLSQQVKNNGGTSELHSRRSTPGNG